MRKKHFFVVLVQKHFLVNNEKKQITYITRGKCGNKEKSPKKYSGQNQKSKS